MGLADGLEELYHLGLDPQQQSSLAVAEGERIDEMRRRLWLQLKAWAVGGSGPASGGSSRDG